ncbi:hypothetical protein [Myxosarcina sp. GI1]|uniref:hypothetical protein n=1 Tax=Myxosarcina sp. GI1 TaxID=1541065 RepID=UPI00055C09CC|nr:hypothetical protein [Myxosarcina sp. GI1]
MENVVIKPLGRVLELAGLISDFQIRQALEIQAQGAEVKFGTILVSYGILKQQTVDFFADELPKLLQQPKTQPLGYYLQEAALIESWQIKSLLEEQKQTGMLLGELIVKKGWLSQKTLDFFLQYLTKIEQHKQLLLPSYRGIIKSLHLENKAASPYSLLREVSDWTGGHPLLTQQLCKIISDSNSFIPDGMEAISVRKLVKVRVIRNWETQVFGEYLKPIQEHLLNNTVCLPRTLLNLYLQILQHGELTVPSSLATQELIKSGLVIERKNKLQVSNRIYQSIFNRDWVEKQLIAIEEKPYKLNKARRNRLNYKILAANKIENEPLTKIAALTILSAISLISPLIIIINNSQQRLAKVDNSIPLQTLSAFCTEPIPADFSDREVWRNELAREKQSLSRQFPDSCQNNLDKLNVLTAIQLGKDNRVLDGVNNLCQVSETSRSYPQAQFWLNRWYNSAQWGNHTKTYLRSLGNCPVAKNLSRE